MAFKTFRGARHGRFSPLLWISSLGAIGILSLGITGTLAQFSASINNPLNEVATAPVAAFGFTEALNPTGPGGTPDAPCATATAGMTGPTAPDCTGVNKYGTAGAAPTPIAPDGTRTTTVRLAHTATAATPGAIPGQLTLDVAACAQTSGAGTGDLCGAATVTLVCTGTGTPSPVTVVSGVTLTAFATGSPYTISTIDADEYMDCQFTITQPSTDPTLQDIVINQPMTWSFTQV